MSVHVTSPIWKLNRKHGLNSTQKLILLKMGDCAWDDGSNAYPAVDTIAEETCLDSRTIQRNLRMLEAEGWITVQEEATHDFPTKYRIALEMIEGKLREGATPPLQDQDEVTPTSRGGNGSDEGGRKVQAGVAENPNGDGTVPPKPSVNPSDKPSEESLESSPKPNKANSKPKRPQRVEMDRIRKLAEDTFSELTELQTPFDKREANKRWWRPLLAICDVAKWDEHDLDLLLRATFLRMEDLTYDAPDQWVKTARSVYAEIRRGSYKPPGSTLAMSVLASYHAEAKARTDADHRRRPN